MHVKRKHSRKKNLNTFSPVSEVFCSSGFGFNETMLKIDSFENLILVADLLELVSLFGKL